MRRSKGKIRPPQPPENLLYYVHPAARFSRSGTGPPLERAGAFFITMKANIYIDGGNLYFGLLKGHPEMKWLDLDCFCRRLVGAEHELKAIKYFTANIKTYPHDPASIERQNLYLQAIAASGGIETDFRLLQQE